MDTWIGYLLIIVGGGYILYYLIDKYDFKNMMIMAGFTVYFIVNLVILFAVIAVLSFFSPEKSLLVTALITSFFLFSCITTFDLRLTQARMQGSDEPKLPRWIVIFDFLVWTTWILLLIINWKYALLLFVVRFILKVLPVLENTGNFIMGLLNLLTGRKLLRK